MRIRSNGIHWTSYNVLSRSMVPKPKPKPKSKPSSFFNYLFIGSNAARIKMK
jgi:hypothetical protein